LFDKYGNRDGVWLDYFQNGNIKSKIEYKSGVIINPLQKYDVNGNLLKTLN
jgi:antitoxin component YwqK of YwqJK toxin-antitoxin module